MRTVCRPLPGPSLAATVSGANGSLSVSRRWSSFESVGLRAPSCGPRAPSCGPRAPCLLSCLPASAPHGPQNELRCIEILRMDLVRRLNKTTVANPKVVVNPFESVRRRWPPGASGRLMPPCSAPRLPALASSWGTFCRFRI